MTNIHFMKFINYSLLVLLSVATMSSCKDKDDEINPEYVKRAEEFKAFIQAKPFQIAEYYSDKPIDYIEDDDQVREETDLWQYVSPWLKDDFNVFDNSTNKVTIAQNAVKIGTDNSEVLVRDFAIAADKDGPYFDFLTHEYNPLRYRLVEFTGNHFIVYADWHSGAKVFTKFQVVAP